MDNLQALWHNTQSVEDEQKLVTEQIDTIIRRKSQNEFDKFKRTVFWEMLFNVAFTVGCVCYALVSEFRAFPVIVGTTFLVIGSFLFWQFTFYRRLCRHPFSVDVHHYLRSALALLKKYVLHYKIVYGILVPVSGMIGLALGAAASQAGTELPLYELPKSPWLAFLVVGALLCLAFLIIHLQFKYLYQPKINRLQRMVDELQPD
jgi:hypothetical protein